jgi:hypothetical protein
MAPALDEALLLRGARAIERLVDFKERAYA